MTADTRTITLCGRCSHPMHWKVCSEAGESTAAPCQCRNDAAFAALPAACCCIEGNDIMLTTCATNDCPEHGTSEADRLLVAMVDTFADGAGVHPAEGHAAIAAARAYIVRKGLA